MFTGIIETIGSVSHLRHEAGNLHITVASSLSDELKIDQSVSHNGVCLTVVALSSGEHTVTAIAETLSKSNLGSLQIGDGINLERCTKVGDRLDGHIVQGHVDQTARCLSVAERQGSWLYTFQYDDASGNITVEKGSITVNGISLTVNRVVDVADGCDISINIIPHTQAVTTLRNVQPGDRVNLEVDTIARYVERMLAMPRPDDLK